MLPKYFHHPASHRLLGFEQVLNRRVGKLDLSAGICNQDTIRHPIQNGGQPGAFDIHHGGTHAQGQRHGFDGIGVILQGRQIFRQIADVFLPICNGVQQGSITLQTATQ